MRQMLCERSESRLGAACKVDRVRHHQGAERDGAHTRPAEGVPGYDGSIWWGVLGPAGIPGAIVARLNAEIGAILRDPEMAKRLVAEAAEPVVDTPEAFGSLIVNDISKWTRIAKQAGIRTE